MLYRKPNGQVISAVFFSRQMYALVQWWSLKWPCLMGYLMTNFSPWRSWKQEVTFACSRSSFYVFFFRKCHTSSQSVLTLFCFLYFCTLVCLSTVSIPRVNHYFHEEHLPFYVPHVWTNPYPIGSMYAIYGNIYHTWILWVYAPCVQK